MVPPEQRRLPTRKSLKNYATAYIGAFLNAVEKEKPEHVPPLARNSPYEIEVCLLPNRCFVMLFERADGQKTVVKDADWTYVEKRVMSDVDHMVIVYSHENPTVADAIARGKKDAVRSIRSLEDSNLAKAVTELESILGELTGIEKGNKSLLKLAELEMSRLQPIKEVVMNSGPAVDMLAMIDSLRNCPTEPVEVSIDVSQKELLETVCRDLGDLSDVIRRVEAQDSVLETLEKSMNKTLSEFQRMIDERMNQGLAVLLSSSDRKIDKGLAIIQGQAEDDSDVPTVDASALEKRMKLLEVSFQGTQSKRGNVSKELVLAVAETRDALERLNARISKLEQKTGHAQAPSVRRLASKKRAKD
ncbi:MAG: hypothetical protein LN411_00200 [Candidatus Thermoplasmatota archaeon]|nr:hypothetical protein [Candidatus Thermoplasmatota archaeon]